MAKPINKQHSKTIHRLFTSMVGLNGVTLAADGTSIDLTTAITSALANVAWHGNAVPMQKSTDVDTEGIRISATQKLLITSKGTDVPVVDVDGNEIYGVLTETGGAYILEFKTFVSGAEAAATLPADDYNFEIPYLFNLEDVPVDFGVGGNSSHVGDDPKGGGKIVQEKIDVTALNTLANLSNTPIAGTVQISVAGHVVTEQQTALSVAGKVLTWTSDANSYDLETTDFVVARYSTFE